MTALEQFGRYVAESACPSDAARELVELHLIDTVGAWMASARTLEGESLLRFRAARLASWTHGSSGSVTSQITASASTVITAS